MRVNSINSCVCGCDAWVNTNVRKYKMQDMIYFFIYSLNKNLWHFINEWIKNYTSKCISTFKENNKCVPSVQNILNKIN